MQGVSDEVQDLARRVAERFHPERIILFGSQAAGRADEGSDVDLLVIMDSPLRAVEQAVAIRRFLNYRRPLDVLVRAPAEIERRVALGDCFLREILEQGVV